MARSCSDHLETSIHSRYSDEEESMNNLSRLQELAGKGVYIRLHPEAHAKFLIVDDELLVTSANIRHTVARERTLRQEYESAIRGHSEPPSVRFSHIYGSMRQISTYAQARMIQGLEIHGPQAEVHPMHQSRYCQCDLDVGSNQKNEP